MNREERKQAIHARSLDSDPEPIGIFSEDAKSQDLEGIQRLSEYRFDSVCSSEAVMSIIRATDSLCRDRGFIVMIADRTEEIPIIPQDACFKYSRSFDDGSLPACSRRIQDGEKITVALVWEEDFLIGYGIAVTQETKSEIEIIDVDYFSRREAELKETLLIMGQSFTVGVGHAVVRALMGACPKPIRVNATTPHSRYVFKSLGFIQDSGTNNPCILRMGQEMP